MILADQKDISEIKKKTAIVSKAVFLTLWKKSMLQKCVLDIKAELKYS